MKEQFREGDVVELKSGSEPMTVERVSDEDLIHCVWFDKKNNFHSHCFPAGTLEKDRANGRAIFTPDLETD